jgi:hypothetical protein
MPAQDQPSPKPAPALTPHSPELILPEQTQAQDHPNRAKKALARKLDKLIGLLTDQLEAKADKISPGTLPISLAILMDKRATLDHLPAPAHHQTIVINGMSRQDALALLSGQHQPPLTLKQSQGSSHAHSQPFPGPLSNLEPVPPPQSESGPVSITESPAVTDPIPVQVQSAAAPAQLTTGSENEKQNRN